MPKKSKKHKPDFIRIRNDTKGPLAIMTVWEDPKEIKVAASQYKREGGKVQRNISVVRKQVPDAFTLMPGVTSEKLPAKAASAEQIVGLHRAKMIAVIPVA